MTRAEVGREMSAKEMTDDVSCILKHREKSAWQKKQRKERELGRGRHSWVEKKLRDILGLLALKNDLLFTSSLS